VEPADAVVALLPWFEAPVGELDDGVGAVGDEDDLNGADACYRRAA
jgi:hypothetical protein